MGTSRGGEALGLPVGRIAPDHAADLVVLDLDALSLQPSATAEKQVVYAMQPDAIRRVIVGGETIVEDGRLDERRRGRDPGPRARGDPGLAAGVGPSGRRRRR